MKTTTACLAILVLSALAPIAAAELTEREWAQATRELQQAIAEKDTGGLKSAVATVARDDSVRAVRAILVALENGRELGVYDAVRSALGGMSSVEARSELAKQAKSHSSWGVRYACLDVAARWNDEKGREVTIDHFDDAKKELAILAYRLAGELRWGEAVEPLIQALERYEDRRDDDRTGEIRGALWAITGKEFPEARLWKVWWDASGEGFRPPVPGSENGGDGETVLERMKRRRFGDYETITGIGEGEIVVVKGVFDEVERVLSHLDIPHRVIEREEFKSEKLDPKQILIFNCHQTDFVFSDEEIDRVRGFVGAGGYLFTSDWDLQNVTARAFPHHVGVGGGTAEHRFRIQIAPGAADDPLMKDVFGANPYEHASMTWQIDGASFLIQVKDRSVKTLVACEELKAQYGSEVVGITFQVRDNAYAPPGRVLHVLSHFVAQRDEKEDRYALQQLLMNFFVEKKKTWAAAARRDR